MFGMGQGIGYGGFGQDGLGYGGMHRACCPPVAPVVGHGIGVGIIAVAILILIALGLIF